MLAVVGLNICVFGIGEFESRHGGVIRFKKMFIEKGSNHVFWIGPLHSRETRVHYSDFEQEKSDNVELVEGKQASENPVVRFFQKERHFLDAVKSLDLSKVDVAIIYNGWGTGKARRYLQKNGIPVVFDYDDILHEFIENPVQRFFYKRVTDKALRECDHVIATSYKVYEYASSQNSRCTLISNSVTLRDFENPKPKKVKKPAVGFIGSFGDWVDFETVLQLAGKFRDAGFYLIGGGQQKEWVDREIKRRGLGNVTATGYVPYSEVKNWIASFDVAMIPFKITGLSEGINPMKLFEYWALKKPAIVTPTYELRKIAKGRAIFASTRKEWEQALEKLLKSAKLRKEVGMKGYSLVKNEYNRDILGKKFMRILRELTGK